MKKYFPALQYANIPNIITTLGLAFAVMGGFFMVRGDLRATLISLSFAMLMDSLDGFAAGKLDRQTSFGQSLDSLVDFFVCCMMPVLIVFTFVGSEPLLIASAALYCICGLWRLSYYNVTASEKRSYFTGLPAPTASLIAAVAIWSTATFELPAWICAIAFILAGLMMISGVKLEKYGLWQKIVLVVGVVFWIVVVMH